MILAYDQHIPLVKDYFAEHFTLRALASEAVIQQNISDADVLLVRSITPVNQALLNNTTINYVATATSGHDHINQAFLNSAGIAWSAAPGCNANSVAQYVVCTIALLQQQELLTKDKLRVGIIGVGHVGRLVEHYCRLLDYDVLLNDPVRAATEKDFTSIPLTAFTDRDIICLHPSLEHDSPFPSVQLINKAILEQFKPGCVLLNASRGEVINEHDLLQYSKHLCLCLDVYANEPSINPKLLNSAHLSTPHIAGYATESKARATAIVAHDIFRYFQLPATQPNAPALPCIDVAESDWQAAALKAYNPLIDSERFHTASKAANLADAFQQCRRSYPPRHEFQLINSKQ